MSPLICKSYFFLCVAGLRKVPHVLHADLHLQWRAARTYLYVFVFVIVFVFVFDLHLQCGAAHTQTPLRTHCTASTSRRGEGRELPCCHQLLLLYRQPRPTAYSACEPATSTSIQGDFYHLLKSLNFFRRVIFPIMFSTFHLMYWTIYTYLHELPQDIVYLHAPPE